jgi:NAD+-dependent secondary alcohol dehydrogenase Adh1
MAEYLLTNAGGGQARRRSPTRRGRRVGDGGLTAYHAVRKAVPLPHPGTTCVVIGAGGRGHIGVQCLLATTETRLVVVAGPGEKARAPATELRAHEVFGDTSQWHDSVRVVLDFVASTAPKGRT